MSPLSYAPTFLLLVHFKIMFAFLVCPCPCPFYTHTALHITVDELKNEDYHYIYIYIYIYIYNGLFISLTSTCPLRRPTHRLSVCLSVTYLFSESRLGHRLPGAILISFPTTPSECHIETRHSKSLPIRGSYSKLRAVRHCVKSTVDNVMMVNS